MPRVTRWLVRSAILWLVAGSLLLVLSSWDVAMAAVPLLAAARPAALHALTVGWLTQVVFGVAHWMFPRPPGSRGAPPAGLAWGQHVMLNAGLLLRVVAEPVVTFQPESGLRVLLLPSALLQVGAAVLFAWAIWPRIRGT